ncbi:hypothetical protein BD410DRAFT_169797 [Rickenella mellea]|uniref:G-protein coupled receptors family 1 profile domain-containing protein n=1 Tax=Rickenella mellea TaxID=50990 RepID=A0A4Y7Q6E6_9AGAM|nr:hypothetical protein BD410DRAFT_169797 [Rickenella mellea]
MSAPGNIYQRPEFATEFAVLHMAGGHVGLPLFVATMLLSKRVYGHYTMINYCIIWIVFSIVFCLTVYDRHKNYSGAGASLCYVQAAMTQGAVPMATTGHVFLVIHIWEGLRMTPIAWTAQNPKIWRAICVVSPYTVFAIFALVTGIALAQNPSLITRDGAFFCSLDHHPINFIVPSYAAILLLGSLIFEGFIVTKLVRHWRYFRQSRKVSKSVLSLITRVGLFSLYSIVVFGASAAFLAQTAATWPYMIEASLPTAAFVIFGTRPDVWKVWLFWRKDDPPQSQSTRSPSRTRASVSMPRFELKTKEGAGSTEDTATLV